MYRRSLFLKSNRIENLLFGESQLNNDSMKMKSTVSDLNSDGASTSHQINPAHITLFRKDVHKIIELDNWVYKTLECAGTTNFNDLDLLNCDNPKTGEMLDDFGNEHKILYETVTSLPHVRLKNLLRSVLKILAKTECINIKVTALDNIVLILSIDKVRPYVEDSIPLAVHLIFLNILSSYYEIVAKAETAIKEVIKLKLVDKSLLLEYLSIVIVKFVPRNPYLLNGTLKSILKTFWDYYKTQMNPSEMVILLEKFQEEMRKI